MIIVYQLSIKQKYHYANTFQKNDNSALGQIL